MNLPGAQTGILHASSAGIFQFIQDIAHQAFKLGARNLKVQMLRTAGIGRDERQIDVGFHGRGQLDLGLLRGFLEPLQSHFVVAQVNALIFLEFIRQVGDQAHIKIVTAQVGVSVGGLDFKNPLTDFQNGNVESPAAQIKDRDLFLAFLVHAVGQSGCRGFVDDAKDVQPRNFTGVLGGLALAVIKVGRNGDDRIVHLLSEVVFSIFFDKGQDKRRDFGWAIRLAADGQTGIPVRRFINFVRQHLLVVLNFSGYIFAADQPLHAEHRVFRVGDRLAFGDLAYQALSAFRNSHYGRRRAPPFGVGNHLRVASIHDRHAGIGGPQIDSYDFGHSSDPPWTFLALL